MAHSLLMSKTLATTCSQLYDLEKDQKVKAGDPRWARYWFSDFIHRKGFMKERDECVRRKYADTILCASLLSCGAPGQSLTVLRNVGPA